MGGSTIGSAFRVMTFGESHGPATGVVIDGVKPGLPLDVDMIRAELVRRRPGFSDLVSSRREPDEPEILSGVFEGRTTGAPICIIVRTIDADPAEYRAFASLFRPGHGDQSWFAKYGVRDWRGGGRQSGRETIGRVAAGAVAKEIIEPAGIVVRAHVVEIAGVRAVSMETDRIDWAAVQSSAVLCADPAAGARMESAIREAASVGESVGGIVEVVAAGVPAGLGEPVFGKLDAELARALMSIGAVKGVEIGEGFNAARLRGSAMVDEMGAGGFFSNHSGGILAGVSSGQPVVCRIAVKPTPTVGRELRTIDVDGNDVVFTREGRSDPCICLRIVPVAEAMTAIVLADALMSQAAIRPS